MFRRAKLITVMIDERIVFFILQTIVLHNL